MDPTNTERAERAARTLDAYAAIRDDASSAEPFQGSAQAIDRTDAVDLITDLFHALGAESMRRAIDMAETHYNAETDEEGAL